MEPGTRFSKAALDNGNGLACPYFKTDPVRYANHKNCHPANINAWAVKDVSQHLWRCHSPRYHCAFCHQRWPTKTHKKIDGVRKQHERDCEEGKRHGGVARMRGWDEVQIMTEAQQSAFESLKGKRGDNEAKIAAWYEALGLVGLPATFHVNDDLSPVADARVHAQSSEMLHPVQNPQPVQGDWSAADVPLDEGIDLAAETEAMGFPPPPRTHTNSSFMQGLTTPEILDPELKPGPPPVQPSWELSVQDVLMDFQTNGPEWVVPSGSSVPGLTQPDSGYEGSETKDQEKPACEAAYPPLDSQSSSPCTQALLMDKTGGSKILDVDGSIDLYKPPSELSESPDELIILPGHPEEEFGVPTRSGESQCSCANCFNQSLFGWGC